ncbi:MAG: iron ABC transporter permease [Eubacteriaceae bacterium]|nr:iron ABC transporter permease [Eubacteriaceae bacterium]
MKTIPTDKRKKLYILAAAVFMLLSAVLNLCMGASGLTLRELWEALTGGPSGTVAGRILWYVRFPRTFACLLAGSALAVSGAVIQKVLANQLASPSIIGVNAGAGLAVTACCAMGIYHAWAIAGFSFAGAMIATFMVVIAGRKSGASRTTVILGGVAVSACLNAMTEAIKTLVPNAATASQDFRVGGFSSVDQARLLPASVLIIGGILVVLTLANDLDVLSLGDDTAGALGLKVSLFRNCMLTLAALLAGSSVSFAGILGFVGLIVPHISRSIVGNDCSELIPFSIFFGAGFVSVCDLISRLIFSPYELPTGILMSFLGGPFFIWLLLNKKEHSK